MALSRSVRFVGLLSLVLGLGAGSMALAVRAHSRAAVEETRRLTEDLSVVTGRDTAGRSVAVTPAGGGVVMFMSTLCPHCHTVLAHLVAAADSAPLPGLTVIALEGAGDLQRVLDSLEVRGATALGPATTASALRDALGATRTPILWHVDANGRMQNVVVGAISAEEAATWVRRVRPGHQ